MRLKVTTNPTESEIQQTQNAICRSWGPEVRAQRRRLAAAKQRWLFNVLIAQPAVPARVA